jgi:NDP-sugar pyrophosphorylase family protein
MTDRNKNTMQAIILAGGKGTRLGALTTEIPKPLVSVGGKPIIEILLSRLRKSGVQGAVLAVNHMAHLIEDVLGDGGRFDMMLEYSQEKEPLSTVAPLRLINNLPDNFLVVNGDVLTDLNFRAVYDDHIASGAGLTVATHKRISRIDYGVLKLNSEGEVTGFVEKPEYDFTVSMGVYVFSRDLLRFVPESGAFGFDDLMLTLLEKGEKINTFPFEGYWLDVGRPDDLEQANRDIHTIEKLLE